MPDLRYKSPDVHVNVNYGDDQEAEERRLNGCANIGCLLLVALAVIVITTIISLVT